MPPRAAIGYSLAKAREAVPPAVGIEWHAADLAAWAGETPAASVDLAGAQRRRTAADPAEIVGEGGTRPNPERLPALFAYHAARVGHCLTHPFAKC